MTIKNFVSVDNVFYYENARRVDLNGLYEFGVYNTVDAINYLTSIKDNGLLVHPDLGVYAKYLGCTEDKADEYLDDALEALVEEGQLVEVNGDHYIKSEYEYCEKAEREAEKEAEQYKRDVMAAYAMLCF